MAASGDSCESFFQENAKNIKGFLLDISGVLIDGVTPIEGSIEAVER